MVERRLRPKYIVRKIGAEGMLVNSEMRSTDPDNVDSPFVLMPRKDPAALAALVTYMTLCEPQLANELHDWVKRIVAAEPIFGTQGKRNFVYTRSRLVDEYAK